MRFPGGYQITPNDDPIYLYQDVLAARSIKDLVRWSGGLYAPPSKFRNW
jgi:malonate decarboxylase alpha subunit